MAANRDHPHTAGIKGSLVFVWMFLYLRVLSKEMKRQNAMRRLAILGVLDDPGRAEKVLKGAWNGNAMVSWGLSLNSSTGKYMPFISCSTTLGHFYPFKSGEFVEDSM
jgi:hypothetical protein